MNLYVEHFMSLNAWQLHSYKWVSSWLDTSYVRCDLFSLTLMTLLTDQLILAIYLQGSVI